MIAINCMGEIYGLPPRVSARGAPDLNMSVGPSLEDELNIDKNTMDTMKELFRDKDKAVLREDFDEAKRLKGAIERLRAIAPQLGEMEDRKRMAIMSEDYDAAKLIKAEIEKIKRKTINEALPPI